jgi:hypothetical protein
MITCGGRRRSPGVTTRLRKTRQVSLVRLGAGILHGLISSRVQAHPPVPMHLAGCVR